MLSREEISKKNLQACPECGSKELVTDVNYGEIICGKCGLVFKEPLFDQRAEWRAFTFIETVRKSRVGRPTSLAVHDKGLSTVIDQINRDALGKELSTTTKRQMLRLRKWQIRSRIYSSVDRNLSQAMMEINRLSDTLRIPKMVEEEAALIYRKVLKKGLIRGRSILSIAAASLYAACRLTGTPRNLKDIVKVSFKDRREIARYYRLLQNNLNLKMPIDDPPKYVSKIASRAGLNQKTCSYALTILKEAKKMRVSIGKGPSGLAAAALYIGAFLNGESIAQRDIAYYAGVTEVTLRKRYKELEKGLRLNLKKNVKL